MTDDLKKLHTQALERFKFVVECEKDQRLREIDALKFKAGDQWPDDIKTARAGLPASGSSPAVPARPMLTIRTLDQPISQVVNQGRTAQLAIKVSPRKDATIDDADVFEGLVRNIEHESHAQTAYLWAYEQAVIAGRGFYRINKDYADESGGFDQVARLERVLNQASVYLDPFAQMADWSDGEWGFVTEDVPVPRYKREYGTTEMASREDQTFTALGDEWAKIWMPGNDAAKCYRIAEYFYVTYDEKEETDEEDESRKRTIKARRVMWGKLNGVEWIDEPQEWDGPDIPIVPVLGMEYNVGGVRCFQGMVEPSMDTSRMINYMASSLAESMGLVSKVPWIGAAGQFESFEGQWQALNTRAQPYVEYNAMTDATGPNILPPPERNLVEPPIQAVTTSIAVFTNFLRSTTGVPDAALGHINPNDKSGKAIEALKQSSEQSTSNYLDNLARAIQRGGEILVNLIPKLYDRPGRVVQILGADDQQDTVMVNAPFMPGPQGQPMPVNGQPPQGAPVKHYDLAKGRYNVVVEVGKSFSTRREEGMAAISALIQANPQIAPLVADLWVGDMDFPGAQAISERLKKMLPPPLQDQKGQPPIPPQVQQQLAVSGKMIEELSAHVNELTQQINGKQVEMAARLEEAKMDNATKLAIAKLQAVTQLAAVDAKVAAENARTFVEAAEERLARQVDALTGHLDRAHEHSMQKEDHAHEHAIADKTQEHAQELAEQGQVHALEQQANESAPAGAE